MYLTINKIWPAPGSLVEVAVHDVIPGGRDKDRLSEHSDSLDGPTRYNSSEGAGVQRYAAGGSAGEKIDDKVREEEGRYV